MLGLWGSEMLPAPSIVHSQSAPATGVAVTVTLLRSLAQSGILVAVLFSEKVELLTETLLVTVHSSLVAVHSIVCMPAERLPRVRVVPLTLLAAGASLSTFQEREV